MNRMTPRLPLVSAALFAVLMLCASGCAAMHGWVSKAGDGPVTGGAQVSVPFGK